MLKIPGCKFCKFNQVQRKHFFEMCFDGIINAILNQEDSATYINDKQMITIKYNKIEREFEIINSVDICCCPVCARMF